MKSSCGRVQRTKVRSVNRLCKLAFLYCLSLPSCVAAAEESVAFSGGSPEVSTSGDTTTQSEVTCVNAS